MDEENWTPTLNLRFVYRTFANIEGSLKILQQEFIKDVWSGPPPTRVGHSREYRGKASKWVDVPVVSE